MFKVRTRGDSEREDYGERETGWLAGPISSQTKVLMHKTPDRQSGSLLLDFTIVNSSSSRKAQSQPEIGSLEIDHLSSLAGWPHRWLAGLSQFAEADAGVVARERE